MADLAATDLRTRYAITTQITDARLDACVASAIRWSKRKIGIEAYNQVFADENVDLEDSEYLDENTTTTDEVALRIGEVTDAILSYAMAEVVTNTNLRIRAGGAVKKEQDAGSPAVGSGTQIVNEYLTPAESQQWAVALRENANRLIAAYVVEQEPVNANSWGRSARG